MNEIKISDHLRNNYDDYYEDGDSEWRRLSALAKVDNIVSLCGKLPHSSILEIGAGEGSILKRLSELKFGDELYALELSSSGVKTIKNKKIPDLMECLIFDGYKIPYENDRFDIAILSHVIEHVEHPRQLLYEASRVAKYVFVEVPLEDNMRLPKDFVFDKVGHINPFTPRSFRWLLQSSNLRVLQQVITNQSKETYTYEKGFKGLINYYIKQVLLGVMPGLAPQLFTYYESIVCEKGSEV